MPWPPKVTTEYVKTKKESLGMLVSFIDFLVVISLMVFIKCLKKSQKIYLAKFKSQTIELDDFTIEMQNLPFDYEYGYDDDALKACLCEHFEQLIKREHAADGRGGSGSASSAAVAVAPQQTAVALPSSFSGATDTPRPNPLLHEVIDINFGKKDIKELVFLEKMAAAKTKFHANEGKLSKKDNLKAAEIEKLNKENEKAKKDFEDLKVKYTTAL